MTRFSRMTVLATTLEVGAVPTFTPKDAESAWRVIGACRAAGAPVIEFTYRSEDGLDVFRRVAARLPGEAPDVILGAGTIYDAATAAQFIAGGASFIVGPTLVPEIAHLCNRRKIAYIPGCGSATEISQAEELGSEIVKLFPAGAFDGPAFIRALLNPSPWSRVMPTAVPPTEEWMHAYFSAGAAAVGVGPGLITDALQVEPDAAALEGRVRELLGWIRDARTAKGAPTGVAATAAVALR
jgi:2-dehydro-3-deoxyphosphogluconate aldolase / (4S)-4-hydroxy-2-oxoglutarate aldolase